MDSTLTAIVLGIVEGVTEFIPVSSTGHLILASHWLGVESEANKLFNVVIQLGAILAVLVLYWRKFTDVLVGLPSKRPAQHFVRNVTLAFLPAMVIGAFAHGVIKEHLFSVGIVAGGLIAGGVAILLIEKFKPTPLIKSTEAMGWKTALTIGFIQCLAMIPGVSRSGASIMGALALGVERKAAAEFSFFLAVPTMLAASGYDLYQARETLTPDTINMIATGFLVSFIVAILVIKWMLGFVTRHGFAPFAWYRIALGAAMLAVIL